MSRAANTALAVALVAASSMAFAQRGGYVGIAAGRSSTSFDAADFSSGVAGISESRDEEETGYKLFAGFDFNRNWAVEAGYVDFGKPQYRYSGAGVSGRAEMRETAWYVAGKGTLPMGDFGLFAKLGASSNKSEASASTNSPAFNAVTGLPYSATERRTDVLYGIGAEYGFRRQGLVRLEFEDFGKFGESNTGRTRVKMWSLGLGYKF